MEPLNKIYDTLLGADRLPSPKGIALEVLRSMEGDEASVAHLAKICEKDPAISARILKAANAPVTGVSRNVNSVKDAAAILGITSVQSIALAFSLLTNNREGSCEGFDYNGFWSRSLARASAMRRAAAFTDSLAPDEAFTYGLLSLIGRLGLASVFPEKYAEVSALSKNGQWVDTAELEIFGVTGEQLSAIMINGWGLPRMLDLVAAELADDHEPLKPVAQETYNVLQFGRGIADAFTAAEHSVDTLKTIGESASRLGMTPEQMFESFDLSIEDWRTSGRDLSVKTHSVPPLKEIYASFA